MFYNKGVEISPKFTGKHRCQSLFSINLQAGSCHRLRLNFAKFLRTPIFRKICERLFLSVTEVFQNLLLFSEAVARRCSVKKMFLEISQNSQNYKILQNFKEHFFM